MAELVTVLSRNKGRGEPKTLRVKQIALIVESAVAPRRMMLTGVARYIQEHEPWAVYLKPVGVEKSLANWLRDWDGDGIIAAVNDPASYVVARRGLPVVDVVGVLGDERVPLVHTNDHSVGRLGAEHLLEPRVSQSWLLRISGRVLVEPHGERDLSRR